MKRIEIGVVNPKAEQRTLMDWAAQVDAGVAMPEGVPQLNFSSFGQLHSTLSERRMDLLEYVACHEGLNIRQLAQALGRDYKNVYEDVRMLAQFGLLEKQDGKLHAPYDEIVTRYSLRVAA